jgi:sorbitol-specific phosphotransferase system component IIBC
MSRILLGVICGLAFGVIDVGIMMPMSFPDKRAAITAAFIARFGIGFAIGAARLPWPNWVVGLVFGLLLSIPDAIITKAYAPIIGTGALGGAVIGVLVGRLGR